MPRGYRKNANQVAREQIEAADAKKEDRTSHTIGWPHHAIVTRIRGNCICNCGHCFGASGCICKSCSGHNHANCKHAHNCAETDWCSAA